jgi:CBS domain-containing protein
MLTVDQVMTKSVLTVRPETPITEVARLLVERGISGLPVCDVDGKVLGVVSEGDLLVREAGHWSDATRDGKKDSKKGKQAKKDAKGDRSKADARTAGEAMTSPALTIEPFRAIRAVAEIMIEHRVNRLPVVDADGKLLGIVSRADLVRAFVRTDAELEETIRTEVIIREMWLDPDKFEVKVDHGVATVTGTVMKRSTAEVIARLLAMVPGVVSVTTDIAWDVDDGGVTVP